MYRISVTTLEKFRRCQLGLTPYDTEEALIESIKGIFLGNDKTKTGGAYHKIIEGDYKWSKDQQMVIADGIAFTAQQAAPGLAYKAAHPSMIHEIPVSMVFQLEDFQVKVTGRIDGMEGISTRDAKLKFRKPDFEEYLDSYQWRLYLTMLGMDLFYYDVFEVLGFEEIKHAPAMVNRFTTSAHLPGVEILECQDLKCERYEGMEDDCRRLLREFFDYIRLRNFYHLLKTTNETALL